MRAKITKRNVDAMRIGDCISDTEVAGFRARRRAGGVTYELRYRSGGKREFFTIGKHGTIAPDEARRIAKKRAGEVAGGRNPAAERQAVQAAAVNTVNVVLDNFLERYVRKQRLRSAATIESAFDRLVRPRIGTKAIYDVTRRDVVELLDAVEDESGPVMADRVLAYLRKAFRWQAMRDEAFQPPIVPGMARTKPAERKRARILDKEEIRDVWIALDRLALGQDAPSCYPAFIRTLLLTGLRRSEAAKGHVEELKDEGWIIPAARMKSKRAHLLPLTESVRALLGKKGFLFSSDGGKTPFSGYSKSKAALDRKIAELRKADSRKPIPDWVLHDLRRTARSLLSRFTTPDVAERVIGHAIPGVRGHYDFHEYAEEKRAALERLGAYIEDIIYPDKAVVAFPKRRRGSKM